MSDQKTVLMATYEAIKQEYNRISNLLYGDDNPLASYVTTVRGKFNDPMSDARILIGEIEKAIQGGNLKEGWDKYVELKTRLMPVLSGELLAIIGGVYLMQAQLDDPRENLESLIEEDRKNPLSFSRMAKELVKDLADRSGKEWESVLIVGEEFFRHSEAEIIRLRFPACDIWNLPFTAHEYGYLVARKNAKVPNRFRKLRDKVRENVDPSSHPVGSPPEHKDCFLREVVDVWDYYHNKLTSSDERDQFLRARAQELETLQDQQETHLCRLFADAFATFFVGPAYVHALLHLRFIPDTTLYHPTPIMPSFAQRFVFALEILKWMNNEPVIDPSKNMGAFGREVAATGIQALWHQALESAQQEDYYEQILVKYKPWLDQIKEALQTHFGTTPPIGTTYENWRTAQELEKSLLTNPVVDIRPKMWAVLNAAWSARWQYPNSVVTIHYNALRLLDPDNITVIRHRGREVSSLSGSQKFETN